MNAREIRALMGIASEAAQAQVVERGNAAVLLSDSMVDRECEERVIVFVNPAVFAPSVGPVPDLRPETSVHQAAPFWPSIRRALA